MGSYSFLNIYENRLLVPYDALGNGALPMTGAEDYTLSMWIKVAEITTNNNLKSNGGVLASFGPKQNENYAGNWNVTVTSAGAVSVKGDAASSHGAGVGFTSTSAGKITLDQWCYFTVVVDNTNLKASIYFDGTLAHEATLSAPMYYTGTDAAFHLGGLGMKAYIDQVELYNTALSAEDVATAHKDPFGFPSLQSLYTLDEKIAGSSGQFANTLENGVDAIAEYNQVKGSGFSVSSSGISGSSNAEYTGVLDASDRPLSYKVIIDPDIENGTLAVTNGGEAIDGSAFVDANTVLTLAATPADGFYFVNAYANGVIVSGNTYQVVGRTTFTASFTDQTVPLTVENPANLEYTITRNGEAVELDRMVPGVTYTLQLTVPDEINLKYVALGDKGVSAEANGDYLFTMPSEAATLLINAAERAKFTLTYPVYEQGTVKVTANGAELASGSIVLEGTVITVNVEAAEGYATSAIMLNGTKIQNGSTYNVNRDIDIQATFIQASAEHCTPSPVDGRSVAGEITNQDARYFTKAVISDGSSSLEITKDGANANAAFGNAKGRPVYDATAAVPQFIVEPGKTITVTTTGAGKWMDSYIFFDSDLNGLDEADLVQFTAGGDVNFCGSKSFTVSRKATTGVYRMRYVLNWLAKENGQPVNAPNPCVYGQENSDNGEVVFDVDIVIVGEEVENERTISVASENDAYGTVAITEPATDETSITTKLRYVTVEATPAEGYSFVNWTDANGDEVSASATFEYEGDADIALTAHFGYILSYSVEGEGSIIVSNANGDHVADGGVVPVASEVVFALTPAAGKTVSSFTVNGEEHLSDLVDNAYTVVVSCNTEVAIVFDDFAAHVSWTVRGNGEVEAGYEWNDEYTGPADTFTSGDMISASTFNAEDGLTLWVYPGETESGDYEKIESVTAQIGDGDATDAMGELMDDGGENGDGLLATGAPVYYYTISELPSADMMVVFVFSQNGVSASIDNIFADDNSDAPVLYYNLDGVRVNGNALTPGIYIVKKGKKTAKVYVM